MSFAGTHTAIVTPFRQGVFDEAAFRELIEAQVAAGADGIVPVGTTGESPTLSPEEHIEVIRVAIAASKRRCKIIAGTGANSTAEATSLTQEAEKLGADAALLVAPYYNKPSQEGIFRHYRHVAAAVRIPLILYSIPGRCGVEIGVETAARLAAACPNIVAIKESGGNVDRVSQLRSALPESFEILSGDDPLTLPFLAAGAVGVVSVASNIIPAQVAALVRAFLSGNIAEAAALHWKWYPLFKGLFVETNPVPIKYALSLQGKISGEVRLPLCEMTKANEVSVRALLEGYHLLPRNL